MHSKEASMLSMHLCQVLLSMIMYVHVRGMDAYVQLGKGVKTEKMMSIASTKHKSLSKALFHNCTHVDS